jgi:hypothetical protein
MERAFSWSPQANEPASCGEGTDEILHRGILGLSGVIAGQEPPALSLTIHIPLPNVKGRIDHASVDLKSQRLFVAAVANNVITNAPAVAAEMASGDSAMRRTTARLRQILPAMAMILSCMVMNPPLPSCVNPRDTLFA